MKKLFRMIAIVFAIMTVFTMVSCPETLNELVADGSELKPFLVSNSTALNKVGSGIDGWDTDKYYLQTADFDLSIPGAWDTALCAESGKPFTGTYNGSGFLIRNTYTGSAAATKDSLFRNIGAGGLVKNLGLVVNINSSIPYVGAIAGVNEGIIENCYVITTTESITHSGSDGVGGLVGYNKNIIRNCYSGATVASTGTGITGAIAARNDGRIEYCYATGEVSSNSYAGGLVGTDTVVDGVINCVALNDPGVITTSGGMGYIGCIAGLTNATTIRNYARYEMTLTYGGGSTVTIGPGIRYGTKVDLDDYKGNGSDTWWSNASIGPGFPSSQWVFAVNSFPKLKILDSDTLISGQ